MKPPDTNLTVVISDCDHGSIEPERRVVEGAGFQLRLGAYATAAEIAEGAPDADALIVQYASVDKTVLDSLSRCRVVVRYGVGVDTIDVDAATQSGVWVANVPDYGVEEVAIHTVAMVLDLVRHVSRLDRSVKSHDWDYRIAAGVQRFSTLTVGVLGQGRIGRKVAELCSGLGARVLAHDIDSAVVKPPCEATTLEEVVRGCDVLCLHLPLDSATHHILDRDLLFCMRPGSFVVNTARGGLIDSDAILAALNDGPLAGAALDVFESEPPTGASRALALHPRVVATPHSAWWSEPSFAALKTEAAQEAVRVLSGGVPRSPVNAPLGNSRG